MTSRDEIDFSYCVDGQDVIVSVASGWDDRSTGIYGDGGYLEKDMLGTSIFDHIADEGTRHIYRVILDRVRKDRSPLSVSYRCDSSDERRYFELKATPLEEGMVRFDSYVVKSEPRKHVVLLEPDVERTEEFLRMCSWCNKIEVGANEWQEAEKAVDKLSLFNKEAMPGITHTICPPCYENVIDELEEDD